MKVELHSLHKNVPTIVEYIDDWVRPQWYGDSEDWISIDQLIEKYDLQRVDSFQVRRVQATHVVRVNKPMHPDVYLRLAPVFPKMLSGTRRDQYTIFKRDFRYKGTDPTKGWSIAGESLGKSHKDALRKFLKCNKYFEHQGRALVSLVRYRNVRYGDYLVAHHDKDGVYKEYWVC